MGDNLYMKGLPAGISEELIKATFSQYGVVVSCKALPSPAGVADQAALLRMATVQEAKWLVDNVNNNIPQGLSGPVQIRFADNPKGLKGAGKGPGLPAITPTTAPMGVLVLPPKPSGPPPVAQSDNLYMKGFDDGVT